MKTFIFFITPAEKAFSAAVAGGGATVPEF
jgi:hypothetical protein